jgi:hypothetical protein
MSYLFLATGLTNGDYIGAAIAAIVVFAVVILFLSGGKKK